MGLLDAHRDREKTSNPKRAKESSTLNFKLLLLIVAIICGNVASGFTTLWGIDKLVDIYWISLLMTITIQGVMTASALIAATKIIKNKSSFLIVYIIPMLVSISFNYIFFYSNFYETSTQAAKLTNEKFEVKQIKTELLDYLTKLSKHVQLGITKEKNNLSLRLKDNAYKKKLELTKYGTGGPGEGKFYLKYKINEEYLNDSMKGVLSDEMTIKSKEKATSQHILNTKTLEDAEIAYQSVIMFQNMSVNYNTSNLPPPPPPGQNKKLQTGQGHIVYDSLESLKKPNLFVIISLIFAVLMDFIIFIWVLVSIFYNISLRDFTNG